MNDSARHFLDCYALGIEPGGGWVFPNALQQARLDYTPASLERMNLLLDEVKARLNPRRGLFLELPGGHNFCALLAFYLVSYIARQTGARIAWHEDNPNTVYPVPHPPGARAPVPRDAVLPTVAMAEDAGVALLPFGWIEAKLFGTTPAPTCAEYVADSAAQLDHAGPIAWITAARCLGMLASYAMYTVSEGRHLMPTLFQPGFDGARPYFEAITADAADSALGPGRAALEAPSEGALVAAFAREARVTLPDGRDSEAIVIELRCHGAAPLAVTVAFPFRAASDPRGFAIFGAQFLEGTIDDSAQALFGQATDAGVREFEWPSGSWAQYRAADDAAQAPRGRSTDHGLLEPA
jgi:hypothetical protein